MRTPIKLTLAVLATSSVISCSGLTGPGPCVHTYKEPVLHVTSIEDSVTGRRLKFIELHDLKINGSSQLGMYALSESYSVVSDDSVFYCNVPFGFGVEQGTYEFTIEAEGYQPRHFKIEDVNYSIFEGGCPSFNDGGKRVDLLID